MQVNSFVSDIVYSSSAIPFLKLNSSAQPALLSFRDSPHPSSDLIWTPYPLMLRCPCSGKLKETAVRWHGHSFNLAPLIGIPINTVTVLWLIIAVLVGQKFSAYLTYIKT